MVAWLLGEWRGAGERKYHLSDLAPDAPPRALAAAIEARWVREQAHQRLKQELGLGHFEGRSWTGLHRHGLMTCIAMAYPRHLRLAEHRANILSADMREIGIGLHQGVMNGMPTAFVTEVFGIPTAAEAVETDKGYQLLG